MTVDQTVDQTVKHRLGALMVENIALQANLDEVRKKLAEAEQAIAELRPKPDPEPVGP